MPGICAHTFEGGLLQKKQDFLFAWNIWQLHLENFSREAQNSVGARKFPRNDWNSDAYRRKLCRSPFFSFSVTRVCPKEMSDSSHESDGLSLVDEMCCSVSLLTVM